MRRTRWLAGAAALWLALQLVLVVWWATVIERQARHIAALEALQRRRPRIWPRRSGRARG